MSSSRSRSPGSSAYANYPETLFLDYGRLTTLSTDAADFTALYMLLMLYRQLVHSHLHRLPRSQAQPQASAVSTEELVRLKKEIWEIGPAHPGLCFMQHRPRSSGGSGSGSGSSGSSRSSSRHERGDRDREAEMRRWRGEIGDDEAAAATQQLTGIDRLLRGGDGRGGRGHGRFWWWLSQELPVAYF